MIKLLSFLTLLSLIVPAAFAGDKKAVAVGDSHALVLKTDGSLWTFGRNTYGQLGDGTTDWQKTPVKIMDGVVQVSASGNTSMAVKKDGSLWAWGQNDYGNLGTGTKKVNSKVPVKILDNIKYVQAGAFNSMAIDRSGNLWAWGWNKYGQLGDGTKTDRLTPVKIMSGVNYVSGGSDKTLIVCDDGSLYWLSLRITTPCKIMDGVKKVSAGRFTQMILRRDGTLWMFGSNDDGLLGDGTTKNRYAPSDAIQIMSGVRDISMGYRHAMAVKNDGSLWAWGRNSGGQLGDGTYVTRNVPVRVDSNVRSVACGFFISLWITTDGDLRMVGEPF